MADQINASPNPSHEDDADKIDGNISTSTTVTSAMKDKPSIGEPGNESVKESTKPKKKAKIPVAYVSPLRKNPTASNREEREASGSHSNLSTSTESTASSASIASSASETPHLEDSLSGAATGQTSTPLTESGLHICPVLFESLSSENASDEPDSAPATGDYRSSVAILTPAYVTAELTTLEALTLSLTSDWQRTENAGNEGQDQNADEATTAAAAAVAASPAAATPRPSLERQSRVEDWDSFETEPEIYYSASSISLDSTQDKERDEDANFGPMVSTSMKSLAPSNCATKDRSILKTRRRVSFTLLPQQPRERDLSRASSLREPLIPRSLSFAQVAQSFRDRGRWRMKRRSESTSTSSSLRSGGSLEDGKDPHWVE